MSDNNNININTPDIGPYTHLQPFRFWCQKVLPLVYDESLSYYELLCKVVDYLNKTMEDVDQMITDMGEFKTADTEFKTEVRDAYIAFSREVEGTLERLETYMNNYFNNLNVQQEINNKLDAMAAAGYFDTLFTTLFTDDIITEAGNVTSAWIAEHLLQETGYVIDNSLTVANAAADAKAAGDAIRKLDGSLTEFKDGFHNLNLFKDAELLATGKFAYIDDGVFTLEDNANFDTYIMPVNGESIYTFTFIRFGVLLESDKETPVGTVIDSKTQIDSTGAAYIAFSFNPTLYTPETYQISLGIIFLSGFDTPGWFNKVRDSVYGLEYDEGVNLFKNAVLLAENKYVSYDDGKLYLSNNSAFNAYLLPVDGKSTYTFQNVRFGLLLEEDRYTAIGSLLENTDRINSTGAAYIAFSFNKTTYPIATYTIFGNTGNVDKEAFISATGSLSDGGELHLTNAKTNIRKGARLIFEGNITAFGGLRIGLSASFEISTASNHRNYFVIDGTNVSYYETPSSVPVVVPHNLTIADNIQIILEETGTASEKVTIISDGALFTHEFENYVLKTFSLPFILSDNSVLTECKLTWTCSDISKKIWIFGDSYIQYSTVRWPYYLHSYGYAKNALIDGYPGEGSTPAINSLNNLLKRETPDMIVWCLGMNDGNDSESAPESDWAAKRDMLLDYCETNDIIPVFATIPTVPSVNNEQKNSWVRNSGYRYIDFEKAVGANSSGVWFTGMLSDDNVHPTEAGAKALFARVLLDLPEIMID